LYESVKTTAVLTCFHSRKKRTELFSIASQSTTSETKALNVQTTL